MVIDLCFGLKDEMTVTYIDLRFFFLIKKIVFFFQLYFTSATLVCRKPHTYPITKKRNPEIRKNIQYRFY